MARVLARAAGYDVLHFHIGMHWLPFATLAQTRSLFTIHTFASYDDRWLARNFPGVALSGISRYQAAQLAEGREIPVVYNGCDFGAFEPRYEAGEYLAFLGRMSHDKNPLGAIRIARAAGMPIVLAGQAQEAKEEAYFEREIRPLIDGESVRCIGAVDHEQKNELLRHAAALVFPIQWPEPFGLVMIEAMACGTPVIAFNRGSVPEVIDEGVTGFIVEDINGAIGAVDRLDHLSRDKIRKRFEERFTARRMAQDYLSVYRSLADKLSPHLRLVADDAPAL
ncbi:MAG TPA: glycosyltransferase family 4 protein [Xanthobacteraceae bacterium]|nr:glycosyltransferase family 4 protein [Xanthobacteraceae bacterium]